MAAVAELARVAMESQEPISAVKVVMVGQVVQAYLILCSASIIIMAVAVAVAEHQVQTRMKMMEQVQPAEAA
jgi:hypothetical protein